MAAEANMPPEAHNPSEPSPSRNEDGGVPIASNIDVETEEATAHNNDETTRTQPPQQNRRPKCRFFATKKGCRAGEACPFLHEGPTDVSTPSSSGTQEPKRQPPPSSSAVAAEEPHQISQTEQDPRTFQVNQIKRRFRVTEETAEDDTLLLRFSMPPSDPDFPFEINALECALTIPPNFPKERQPTLRVTNKVMERGYQVNVERGFDAIWLQAADPTLLNAMKMLDKRLEVLLTAQKAEIVTLIANSGMSTTRNSNSAANPQTVKQAAIPPPTAVQKPVDIPRPVISPERRAQAKAKREAEVQMLEHRLGRHAQFSKDADDTLFTMPIEPRKRVELPTPLQAIKTIQILVPIDYDIEPCSVELLGVEGDAAQNVSAAFLKRTTESSDTTLLAHVNYLAQNMHLMAAAPPTPTQKEPATNETSIGRPEDKGTTTDSTQTVAEGVQAQQARDTDREHVKIIQRPPEWDAKPAHDGDEESSDGYDSEFDSSEDLEDDEGDEDNKGSASNEGASAPREKGILISFPGLELYSIELLELILINITVKCERCKDTLDVPRIKPQAEETQTPTTTLNEVHSTSCKKCANAFSIGYRKDIMHAHSNRAGYLDLEGCTIVDLLPSTFLPTCADCSTPASANGGVVSVRGESPLAICRSCHCKLNFRIPEVKFLRIGPSNLHNLPLKQARRTAKESLGIIAGTPLPSRGSCKHYSKSYRWFRFSCCNAVYPCDRCHDKETDHPNDFANRMICGWCSREQHYRPEDCIHCRKGVTGRTGSGFWEGGKGTRERARMSRKDPRKYKRRGGGAIASKNK